MSDNLRDDKDHQPTHNQIKGQAEFLIDLLGKDFVENAEDSRAPLNRDNQIAPPVIHERKDDGSIAARDGNVDHRVINNPQDIFVGRAIGHGVVNGGGEKHEEKADDKDRSTDSRD